MNRRKFLSISSTGLALCVIPSEIITTNNIAVTNALDVLNMYRKTGSLHLIKTEGTPLYKII